MDASSAKGFGFDQELKPTTNNHLQQNHFAAMAIAANPSRLFGKPETHNLELKTNNQQPITPYCQRQPPAQPPTNDNLVARWHAPP